jgi:arsenate reductase
MAEAIFRKLAGDNYEVLSAGLEPTSLHPMAIEVMREIGIDISGQRSKSVVEYLAKVAVKIPIIVCRKFEENCPSIWPFASQVLSWPFDDPAEAASSPNGLQQFRRVRDEIEGKIREWLQQQSDQSTENGNR